MAVSLTDLAKAIAERAERVIRTDYFVPDTINEPACFVNLGTIERQAMVMGVMEIDFELVVLTSKADARTGQLRLYELANPDRDDQGSLWWAFETNTGLGLAGTDVKLLRFRPLGIEEVAAYGYFGGAFEGVALITKGAL